ncbi:MAG: TonB-dependent receptor [Deltaproteobacteria bacterium]|nr:TonB-dependent receptor [Deltaproteobacteria bacterium]
MMFCHFSRFFLLSLAVLLLIPAVASSASANGENEVYTLGEVVVTAKNGGVEATQAVQLVTAEEIKSKNAKTLDEAINLLPGVNIRLGGEGVPRIDIRGFKTRHVILLLNGVPLNSAFDQQFDPSVIPTENIAMIKMTTGPSSVLYGQGGLGGVINIITKKGTKGINGMIAAETGDHEPYLGRASLSGGAGKYDFFLSGRTSKQNSFPLSDDFTATPLEKGKYRSNSDNERNNGFANIGYQATSELTLGLTVDYHQGEFGKPPSVILNPSDPFASKPKYERIDDYRGFSAQLAGEYTPSGPFSLKGWVFTNQLEEHDNYYDDGNFNSFSKSGSAILKNNSSISGLSLHPKYDLGRAGVMTGAFSYEQYSFDQNGFQMSGGGGGGGSGHGGGGGGGGGGGTATKSDVNVDKYLNIYSVSVEYEVSPIDKLGFVLGYGHYFQSRSEKDDNDFSVLVGAHYDVLQNTRLKAAFNRNIRFPSLSQLYDAKSGNLNLKTEVAYLYQLGLEQKLPWHTQAGLTGFYTDATNFIEKNDLTNMYENNEKDRFIGFEATLEARFVKNLLLRASYTYLYSEDMSNSGKDELQYRPQDKLVFDGKYDFDFGLTPSFSYTYIANQFFYSKPSAGPLQKGKLNDYSLVDVKLNQKFMNGKVNLYFGANNIFDVNYETSYGYPQTGRFIYGGVEFATSIF